VAGEIVDKIRGLDPPGRFLKKDRDSGYWLDIGDNRAKEKTSQALREGAPLIRQKLKEGLAMTDEEGGTQSETASPEKSVASVIMEQAQVGKESSDDGKRKAISPVQELKGVNDEGTTGKTDDTQSKVEEEDESMTPSPKRKRASSPDNEEKTIPPPPPPLNSKPTDKNDDDNASNLSMPTVQSPTAQNTNNGSQNPLSPETKVKSAGSNEDDDSITSLTPTKRKLAEKVSGGGLTQEDRALYSVFDPPRALKNESTEEKGEKGDDKINDEKTNDEKDHPEKG